MATTMALPGGDRDENERMHAAWQWLAPHSKGGSFTVGISLGDLLKEGLTPGDLHRAVQHHTGTAAYITVTRNNSLTVAVRLGSDR